jgi:hypothetical protein
MVFSSARLNKYKIACDGDNIKALILYRHNIKLCQKFYGVLNVFEVALRNAIDRHKSFRNKIAHHEAICFNSIGQKSMLPAQTHYELILKYVEFLGYSIRVTESRMLRSNKFITGQGLKTSHAAATPSNTKGTLSLGGRGQVLIKLIVSKKVIKE